ncbi:MAG: nucleotidyltransferase domain-containing protein, partial [Pseudonocardia sp.]|nr:nucleotidyltransferase domain-containing protein [Pseudonocardia sp.]
RYGASVSVTAGVEVAGLVRSVLGATPAVVVGYLFGSRAAGRPRADSDVDVAVLLRDDDHEALLGLVADLSHALAPLHVDLVDLRTAPDALAYRVLQTGTLVVSRDEGARRSHWVRVVDRYLDMAPARRMLADGTRRRLREGRFGRS